MKLARFAFRSINANSSHQSYRSHITRSFSTNPFSGNGNAGGQNSESVDDFESRIFGGGFGNSPSSESFFRKLDRLEKTRNWPSGLGNVNEGGNGLSNVDDLDDSEESFDTLSDGMDGKLKKAASYFEVDAEEIENDDHYAFRPDGDFQEGGSYEPKDLDLRRAPRPLPPKSEEFEVTTEEVLRKADFRNVRFLANFITEAGIIIKRSKTGISAKAQRKVAREIKTARTFGLMPFTTMGTKSFVFGKTMEDQDKDFEYRIYDRNETDEF